MLVRQHLYHLAVIACVFHGSENLAQGSVHDALVVIHDFFRIHLLDESQPVTFRTRSVGGVEGEHPWLQFLDAYPVLGTCQTGAESFRLRLSVFGDFHGDQVFAFVYGQFTSFGESALNAFFYLYSVYDDLDVMLVGLFEFDVAFVETVYLPVHSDS